MVKLTEERKREFSERLKKLFDDYDKKNEEIRKKGEEMITEVLGKFTK